MKIKLSDLLAMNRVLTAVINDGSNKLDPLFKFRLLGIMKAFEPHVSNFETIRIEKINEYGTETEDGNIIIPNDDQESVQKFRDDLTDVINSDVEVTISKLKAADVFDKGLDADYLVALYPLIEEC